MLTAEMIEEKKGGIIGDIELIEIPARLFFLPKAIAHFIALETVVAKPNDFELYHRFLCKYLLAGLRKWEFAHVEMKWDTLKAICDTYVVALNTNDLDFLGYYHKFKNLTPSLSLFGKSDTFTITFSQI